MFLSVILNLKCAGRGGGRYPPKKVQVPSQFAFENGIALTQSEILSLHFKKCYFLREIIFQCLINSVFRRDQERIIEDKTGRSMMGRFPAFNRPKTYY